MKTEMIEKRVVFSNEKRQELLNKINDIDIEIERKRLCIGVLVKERNKIINNLLLFL